MFRDVNGDEPFTKKQSSASGASSSSIFSPTNNNYLIYLLLLSVGFMVFLPYFPMLFGGGDSDEPARAEPLVQVKPSRSSYKKGKSSSSSITLPASTVYTLYDQSESLRMAVENRCENMEVLVVDLQRVVQSERERTLLLENEIRVLQMSENFLKDRVQYLEERSWESRRETSFASSTSSSAFSGSSSSPSSAKDFMSRFHQKAGGSSTASESLIQDLVRMVMVERDRTSELESEIRHLQRSESMMQARIQKLEDQLTSSCKV